MLFLDLLFFLCAVYGISWVISRSKLTEPLRNKLKPVRFIGSLIHCIVCTGTWIAFGLMFLVPYSTWFGPHFKVTNLFDAVFLLGFSITGLWIMGRLLGDAD
jgi:hypothetical protein